ncbi:hypothetical protein J7400_16245 [Shimia sp. R9_2]|uniref:hypothetical protein n=1 Tax=Shimia sp. R9_2 TaxID=2821112 RepID=UPI001ADAA3FE|nr:hypothetical protein [Shimia sp. R9_2]MBO9398231.1 hypothetical protein [Shimia sp. R9_2]
MKRFFSIISMLYLFSSGVAHSATSDTKYINGFIAEIDKAFSYWYNDDIDFSSAEYYIDNGLLPTDYDWESVFVLASHAPRNPNSSLGRASESSFFKRGPEALKLLSKIRPLDLSRDDLLCLVRSRGLSNDSGHIPLALESMNAFRKGCTLLEVSYRGITSKDDLLWLSKLGAEINGDVGNAVGSGLVPLIVLHTIVPYEVQSNGSRAINKVFLYVVSRVVEFDVKYSHTFNGHIPRGIQSITTSSGGYNYSDHLTSRIDFGGDAGLLWAYCEIANSDKLASYSPNFPLLTYFFENDPAFARFIIDGNIANAVHPCHRMVKRFAQEEAEINALRDSALTAGNIKFLKAFDEGFSVN